MPDFYESRARKPRGAVKLNGEVIQGWVSWEVDNNAYRSADTFRVVFVLSMLPANRSAAWFADQSSMEIEIFTTDDGADPYVPTAADSLIYGQVDEMDFDPVRGIIELTGRDLTALLIDTKNSFHFPEKSSSQIATFIAEKHGLTPVVTETSAVSGNYYQMERVSLQQQQSDWELLTFLANYEDFLLYVKGHELHFEPRPSPNENPYVIAWEPPTGERAHPVANVVELKFTRALTIAKGVIVVVRSWNAKQKKGFTASWPKEAKQLSPGQVGEKTQIYRYSIAGLTQDQAQQRAQSIYKQIVAHEMRLTAYLPAENELTCARSLLVRGSGTTFDQIYYPESIVRSMSLEGGYRMDVRAKNTGPELEATTE